ncbi:MAG: DUF1217 domain-containing protein [Roseobacter sp.]
MTFFPITLGSGLTGYNYLARTRDQQQAIFDQNPINAREVGIAAQKLETIQTPDELLEDRTLLKVTLGAFGLEEDLDNRAFLKRILESDLSNSQSLANRLTDKRYLALAETFNFSGADGARLPNARSSDELTQQLEGIQTSDDLLSDPSLLRAALERFGLEDNLQNTYFLQQVLDSDLSDPESFANRFNDESLTAFAETFGFHQKRVEAEQSQNPLDLILQTFDGRLGELQTAEDLTSDPELLEATLGIFGLPDIYSTEFLTDVLASDLNDSESLANTQQDPRFAALAAAFNFATPVLDESDVPVLDEEGETVFQTGTLQTFLDAVNANGTTVATPDDLLLNRDFKEATFDLLGLPQTFAARQLAQRVLDSEPNDPASFAALFPDERYSAMYDLFPFDPVETERTYPEGFVEEVVRNYLDRQFEIQVGDVEPEMRIALSLERELNQVVENSQSNDAQWFSVMASEPLRQAFEGALRLPSSFGSIDIDQQLQVLKDRSQQFFGTENVRDFLETDQLDGLRESYLVSSGIETIGTTSNASIASIILSGF